MSRPRAARSNWQTEPLPDQHVRLDLDLHFTPAEMEKIERGLVPEEMEDKWFVFFEDDTLHLHRSWTGHCVYQVSVEDRADGSRATHALVNRDPEQYSETDDDRDRQLIAHLIDTLLLGKLSTYPTRSDLDRDQQTLEQWSTMGQAITPDSQNSD